IDAISGDEYGPFPSLGKKVAQGAIQRARQPDCFARLRHDREGAIDLADRFSSAFEHPLTDIFHTQDVNSVGSWIGEIKHSFNVLLHTKPPELFSRHFLTAQRRSPPTAIIIHLIASTCPRSSSASFTQVFPGEPERPRSDLKRRRALGL